MPPTKQTSEETKNQGSAVFLKMQYKKLCHLTPEVTVNPNILIFKLKLITFKNSLTTTFPQAKQHKRICWLDLQVHERRWEEKDHMGSNYICKW